MLQEHLAVTCNTNPTSVALENGDTESFFQFADRFRHRRLADVQDLSRAHDTFLSRDFQECIQVAKLDAGVDHIR
ncbi:Uncharacterised protein [Mycobacterium tuberculosis]|nr:Uncharacterised protein [Mycobacterium tuberculosis]